MKKYIAGIICAVMLCTLAYAGSNVGVWKTEKKCNKYGADRSDYKYNIDCIEVDNEVLEECNIHMWIPWKTGYLWYGSDKKDATYKCLNKAGTEDKTNIGFWETKKECRKYGRRVQYDYRINCKQITQDVLDECDIDMYMPYDYGYIYYTTTSKDDTFKCLKANI